MSDHLTALEASFVKSMKKKITKKSDLVLKIVYNAIDLELRKRNLKTVKNDLPDLPASLAEE